MAKAGSKVSASDLAGAAWTSGRVLAAGGQIVISNIPTTLRRLEVTWDLRSDAATPNASLYARVNGAASANNYHHMFNEIAANNGAVASNFYLDTSGTDRIRAGTIPAASAFPSLRASGIIEFPELQSSDGRCRGQCRGYFFESGTNHVYTNTGFLVDFAGPYQNVTLFAIGNLVAGTWAAARGWYG